MSARASAGRLTPQVSPPVGAPTQAASGALPHALGPFLCHLGFVVWISLHVFGVSRLLRLTRAFEQHYKPDPPPRAPFRRAPSFYSKPRRAIRRGLSQRRKGPSDVGGLIPSCGLGHLRLFLDWACRQLQYRSPLPRSELSDKNDCTV